MIIKQRGLTTDATTGGGTASLPCFTRLYAYLSSHPNYILATTLIAIDKITPASHDYLAYLII